MSVTLAFKQFDTMRVIEAQFFADNQPANLNGASVLFCMGRTVSAPMEAVDPGVGRFRYTLQPGDTDLPGTWRGEFIVTTITGETQRVPSDGYLTMQITRAVCRRDDE